MVSALAFPLPTMAGVGVSIHISLPPPIPLAGPPELIMLPGTSVYVAPDVDTDIFFYGGWWWRSWEGRWYRSHNYNSGWGHYRNVPSFYRRIPSDWRNDYREHRWKGQKWDTRKVPHQQVEKNWRNEKKGRGGEKRDTRGVQRPVPHTQSQHPARNVQPQQSRSQHKEVKSTQSEQHRATVPQSRQRVEQKHSKQPQKDNEGRKREN